MTAMTTSRRTLIAGVLCAAFSMSSTAREPAPSHYRPGRSVSGTIRLCGDEHMAAITHRWAKAFRKFQPDVQFEFKLAGTGAAMPCIYSDTGDIALLGRESDITDDNGFFKSVGGYKPLRLELMNGSLDVPGLSAAPVVFVHKDNPLARLTLAQLDAIFGVEHRRGLDNIRTWGELGLTGAWKDRTIHLYGYDIESEDGLHFVRTVLLESRKLNWDRLTEFNDHGSNDSGRRIVRALEDDRDGLALSNLKFADAGVKAVPVAAGEGAPGVLASERTIVSRRYPLARRTYAFVNRRPGTPLDAKLDEFLRYVLSADGQRELSREHGYLPLSRETRAQQIELLK
jgi:phosphate transport system substrate-binding protein